MINIDQSPDITLNIDLCPREIPRTNIQPFVLNIISPNPAVQNSTLYPDNYLKEGQDFAHMYCNHFVK